jgi:hypothetical protein
MHISSSGYWANFQAYRKLLASLLASLITNFALLKLGLFLKWAKQPSLSWLLHKQAKEWSCKMLIAWLICIL